MMNKDKNSLNRYLEEIGGQPLLTDEEERQLAERIEKGDDRAVERLTSANLTFVVSLARQYAHRGLAMEDLVSEGNIGMFRAATKFRADTGKRFVAFAAPYIRDAMEQAIEQQAGLYRVPRDAANTSLEKKRSRALSIDEPLGGSHELSLERVLPDRNAVVPGVALEKEVLIKELRSLMEGLDEREQRVISSLYGIGAEPKTMMETGLIMGLKRERVRQIRDKAIRKICKMTKNSALKDYLKN
ncbi:MAG: sigma-70 family RNA polymerase sigma factor [Prevotella sp.]|jgi:RNA polymerase primary sigma factor